MTRTIVNGTVIFLEVKCLIFLTSYVSEKLFIYLRVYKYTYINELAFLFIHALFKSIIFMCVGKFIHYINGIQIYIYIV